MSAQFIWSPNDLATRTCQAQNCPDDALTGHALCPRHQHDHTRGKRITLHIVPEPGAPSLWCAACKTDKPDADFPLVQNLNGRPSARRGRFWCCDVCVTKGKHK